MLDLKDKHAEDALAPSFERGSINLCSHLCVMRTAISTGCYLETRRVRDAHPSRDKI